MHCPYCQSPREPEARFCVECGRMLYNPGEQIETAGPSPFKTARWRRPLWVGLALFCSALLAALAYLAYERTHAVAYVNGEKISYADWQSEVNLARPLVENLYGSKVFQGKEGKENYKVFRYQVLESLIRGRLLRQEARKTGVTITPEEIQSRLSGMAQEEGLSVEEFLKQQGLSRSQAAKILSQELLQDKLVRSQLESRGMLIAEPQLYGQASRTYLNNLWSRSEIRFVDNGELQRPPRQSSGAGSCCGSGQGGGCSGGGSCGTKSPQPLDPKIEQQAREAALKAYAEKYGPAQVMAAVTNYGCHIQMDIIDKGKILKSYAYREGKAIEIN